MRLSSKPPAVTEGNANRKLVITSLSQEGLRTPQCRTAAALRHRLSTAIRAVAEHARVRSWPADNKGGCTQELGTQSCTSTIADRLYI